MVWGFLGALLSAVAYGVASVMQAVAAKAAPDAGAGVDPRLLLRVLRQWKYLLGLGLDVLGFVAQIGALHVLPLFVVQATQAASLAVTAVGARVFGVRLGAREWTAVAVVCAGLALLGSSAESEGSEQVGLGFRIALIGAVVVLGLAGLAAGRARRGIRTPALGLVAGLCFGLVAVGGRVIPSLAPLDLLRDPALYVVAVAGGMAMLFYATALQRGSVTTSTAMMVLGETVLPSLVGVVFLGDRTRPGFVLVALAGFVLAVAAALALARFGEPTPAAETADR
ncbi:DMT family transporter [Amycolatopsis jiangsuensis]|uniref:Drug/metabolite transporter (DMT)-like permease n=1 Tax=Amycolatopsis jiangsuensis TaxID=1181879 RepID=A0A840IPG1_9PSEU|nr:DMT family transporter [Amycolatopsis jiangsuensis]MBB4683335.1 drug/metabolite transporter (DMT)-like permease [Amycolatopsis jiangsuensis]